MEALQIRVECNFIMNVLWSVNCIKHPGCLKLLEETLQVNWNCPGFKIKKIIEEVLYLDNKS